MFNASTKKLTTQSQRFEITRCILMLLIVSFFNQGRIGVTGDPGLLGKQGHKVIIRAP